MNKTALITGAAKGIGRAIALELAKNGYDVVINYLTSQSLALDLEEEIKMNYDVRVMTIKADVSKEADVDLMFNTIEENMGGVDILINNAAVDIPSMFFEKNVEDYKRTLDINLIGPYLCAKRAYKHIIDAKWGRIINISSTNGINTYYPIGLEYDSSKAALNSLTHNLAIQFAPYATVNAIAPGFIGTESELEGYDEEFLKLELDKIMLRRYGEPSEVAKLVRFLVSDDGAYINNSIIRIDGGQYSSN